MSNRFHNKFHKHNHHTRPTDRDGLFPDSAYDPIASPEAPFQGEFYVDGDIMSMSAISAAGDLFADDGLFHGNVVIEGNLEVQGQTTRQDTYVIITSALELSNTGTGPALKVYQTGIQPLAWFIDNNGDDIIFDNNGYVGLGTFNPNEKLTVVGNVSATGNETLEGTLTVGSDAFFKQNAYTFVNQYVGQDLFVDTETFVVKSDVNKVGIRTASPNHELTVVGSTSATRDSFVNRNLAVGEDTTIGGSLWLTGSEYIGQSLTVNVSSLVVDSVLERVGINTSTPNEALTIVGGVSATENLAVEQNAKITGDATIGGYQRVTGSVYVSGSETIDGTLKVNTLNTGATNYVATQDSGTITTREVNYRVWDTTAEFVSSNNIGAFNLPVYTSLNTLGRSPIRFNPSIGITIATNLSAGGSATINGQLSASGQALIGGNTDIGGSTTINGQLSASRDLFIGGTADIGGSATINGQLSASGRALIGGNTDIGGNTTINGTISASRDLLIGGSTTINDTLSSGGSAFLGGSTTIRGTLSSSSGATFGGSTVINGNLSANGSFVSEGAAVIKGTLSAVGNTFLDENLVVGKELSVGNLRISNAEVLAWNDSFTTVSQLSTNWNLAFSSNTSAGLSATTLKVDNVYSTVRSFSSNWDEAYDTIQRVNTLTTGLNELSTTVGLNAGVGSATVVLTGSVNLVNFDVGSQTTLYYVQSALGPFALNVRGGANLTLNDTLNIGQTLSIKFVNTNGLIPRQLYEFKIDGKLPTLSFRDGSSNSFPTAVANTTELWTFDIIKYGENQFSVLGDVVKLVAVQRTQLGTDIDGETSASESGISVSLNADGDILAVGSHKNDGTTGVASDDRGSVRVYSWNHNNWNQIGADIDGEAGGDQSGISVSLNQTGNVIAIGANLNDGTSGLNRGSVRIYQLTQPGGVATWTKVGSDIDGEAAGDESGISVDLNAEGNIIAIGAYKNDVGGLSTDNRGSTRVYIMSSTSLGMDWTQLGADIDGEAAGDQSGISVCLNSPGNILAVGANLNDGTSGTNRGSVRVFELSSTSTGLNWIQIGSDIDGESSTDESGISVSLNAAGNILAVGAHFADGLPSFPARGDGLSGIDSGHVKVYELDTEFKVWNQMGFDVDGEAAGDRFGTTVSLNSAGDRLAVGAPFNDGIGADGGSVRVYEWNSTNGIMSWIRLCTDIDGEAANDRSGISVSLNANGDRVAIGSHLNDGTSGVDRGSVRVYDVYSNALYPIGKINLHNALPAVSTIEINQTATYSLVADSTPPGTLIYQWKRDGLDVEGGATSVKQVTATNLGVQKIYCLVRNTTHGTTAKTEVVTLSVIPPEIRITTQPLSISTFQGIPITFTTAAESNSYGPWGGLRYQWQLQRPDEIGLFKNVAATNPVYTIPLSATADVNTFTYRCNITNFYGSNKLTNEAILTVNPSLVSILSQPSSISRPQGVFGFFALSAATPAGGLSYQWRQDGIDIPNANNSTLNLRLTDKGTYKIVCNVSNSTYSHSTLTNEVDFVVTTAVVYIDLHPIAATNRQGNATNFQVLARTDDGELGYQWKINGIPLTDTVGDDSIQGATTQSLTIKGHVVGSYSITCEVTNLTYSVSRTTNTAVFTVTPAIITIISQPTNLVREQGVQATYSVTATTNAGTLAYQWKQDGVNVGTNSSSLTIDQATLDVVGTYNITCEITNTTYHDPVTNPVLVTTDNATLQVVPAVVTISNVLPNLSRAQGYTATYNVIASTAVGTLSYQWKRDGVNVGTNSPSYTLSDTILGNYNISCVVTNITYGVSSTTNTAVFTVVDATVTIIAQPTRVITRGPGQIATFGVAATSPAGTISYQWFNSNGIAVTTNAIGNTSYTTSSNTVSMSSFYCVATNSYGPSSSSNFGKLLTNWSFPSVIWTLVLSDGPTNFTSNYDYYRDIAYGASKWVTVGADGYIKYSTNNGDTWTAATNGFDTNDVNSLIFRNGIFMAVGENGSIYKSTDGVSWTAGGALPGSGTKNLLGANYSSGNWVVFSSDSIWTSNDNGNTWTSRATNLKNLNSLATDGAGKWIIIPGGIGNSSNVGQSNLMSVDNGITWSTLDMNIGGGFNSGAAATLFDGTLLSENRTIYYAFSHQLWYYAADGGNIWQSVDGINWYNVVNSVPYINTRSLVEVPAGGLVYTGQSTLTTENNTIVFALSTNNSNYGLVTGYEADNVRSYAWPMAESSIYNVRAEGPNGGKLGVKKVVYGNGYWMAIEQPDSNTYNRVNRSPIIGSIPIIVSQPTNASTTQSGNRTFSVAATTSTGGTLSYQWYKNEVPVGTNSTTYTVAETTTGDYTVYCAVKDSITKIVTNTNVVILTVAPEPINITLQPTSTTTQQGQTTTYNVLANSIGGVSYQWRKNGVNIPGATSTTLTLNDSVVGTYTITCLITNTTYGSTATTNPVTQTINPVAINITAQPLSVSRQQGQSATFSVAANAIYGLSYQWKKDGIDIPGATGTSVTITEGAVGSYSITCAITDVVYSNTITAAAATLTITNVVITITSHPSSIAKEQGVNATFSITASSIYSLVYQWKKDGVDIPGATNTSVTINEGTLGTYSITCVVTETAYNNSITSNAATLTITNAVVTITGQPSSLTVGAYQAFTLSVTATTGAGTLAYQWRRNGVNISGATNSSVTITENIGGDYLFLCIVTNTTYGVSTTSNNATVKVVEGEYLIDPYFNTTEFVLNGDVVDSGQNDVFLDNSSNNLSLTAVGNTAQGNVTPFSPYSWSAYFNGTTDYLSFAGNSGFAILTPNTPFTIEFWVSPEADGGVIISEQWTGGSNTVSMAIAMSDGTISNTNGRIIAFGFYNGTAWGSGVANTEIPLNTWTHVACIFTGLTTKIYLNGVDSTKTSSPTPPTSWSVTGVSGDSWFIGRRWDTLPAAYFRGYLSNLRFVNGQSIYNSNFTPSTIPLTTTTNGNAVGDMVNPTANNVKLLVLQSNTFADNSP